MGQFRGKYPVAERKGYGEIRQGRKSSRRKSRGCKAPRLGSQRPAMPPAKERLQGMGEYEKTMGCFVRLWVTEGVGC